MVPVDANQIGGVVRPDAIGVVHDEHRGLRSQHDVEVLGVRARAVVVGDDAAGEEASPRGVQELRHLARVILVAHRVDVQLAQTRRRREKLVDVRPEFGEEREVLQTVEVFQGRRTPGRKGSLGRGGHIERRGGRDVRVLARDRLRPRPRTASARSAISVSTFLTSVSISSCE